MRWHHSEQQIIILVRDSSSSHNLFSSEFMGGFTGAFFAFIFGLFAYWINKRFDRFVAHKNSIVKLENLLNRHLDEMAVMQFQAKDAEVALRKREIPHSRFVSFKLSDGLELEFGSLDISNRYLGYSSTLARVNIDLTGINHGLTRLEDLIISGQNPNPQNNVILIEMLNGLNSIVNNLIRETKEILVIARLHTKEIKRKNSFLYGVFNNQWEVSLSENEIRIESEKLDKEIEFVGEESARKMKV